MRDSKTMDFSLATVQGLRVQTVIVSCSALKGRRIIKTAHLLNQLGRITKEKLSRDIIHYSFAPE